MTLTELAVEIVRLSDTERRELNLLLLRSNRTVVDGSHLEGYRELTQKCATLESELSQARSSERELVLSSIEKAARYHTHYCDEHSSRMVAEAGLDRAIKKLRKFK